MKDRPRHSTVPTAHPPRRPRASRPPARRWPEHRTHIEHIAGPREPSLLDLVDGLLNKGVVLNADLILALADVDLVYVRLSALLCAADRLIPKHRA